MEKFYNNTPGVLATMHGKESVIAPIVRDNLGLTLTVPIGFDTDVFGTFSGEKKRILSQKETVKQKALEALRLYGGTIAVASEGSFVPHPDYLGVLHANYEMVVLIDTEKNFEVYGYAFSLATNLNQATVTSKEDAIEFAKKIGFPDHGIIISYRKPFHRNATIIKNIHTYEDLSSSVDSIFKNPLMKKISIETDMRAHRNPTRMKIIADATHNLVKNFMECCPECDIPGFSVTKQIPGLPCEYCGAPTSGTLSTLRECLGCGFKQETQFPSGKTLSNQKDCPQCNP